MNPFFTKLLQRKLVHWGLAYLAGAWVLLQVLALMADSLTWPPVVMRVAMPLAAAGFFVALILAWYHGERGRQRVSAPELLMLAAVFLLAGVGVYWARGARRAEPAPAVVATQSPQATQYRASIAVLPFDDLTGARETYFGEGLAEEIIGRLAEVPGLKVISRHSAVVLKRSGLTLPQIADSLGVQYILEGSVRRGNDRVRVRAQLIDPRNDTQLWSQAYDRELKDILAVQDEIAREVSTAMMRAVNLMPAPSRALNPRAFDAYLRGTQAVGARTQPRLLQAAAAFREAIELDSTFALAYSGLAEAYGSLLPYGYRTPESAYVLLARAMSLADRAIALDPTLAEGYAVRGFINQYTAADTAAVLADLARALQLQPNSGRSRIWYATALQAAGRLDESLRHAAIAIDLDPLTPRTHFIYSGIALATRKYDLALAEAERAQLLEPNLGAVHRRKLAALILLNRPAECVAALEGTPLGLQAACWHIAQNPAMVAQTVQRFNNPRFLQMASYDEHEAIAAYYAWRGDVKNCIDWLQRGVRLTPYIVNPRMTRSAFYDQMWTNPEFRRAFDALEADIRRRVASELARS